MLFWSAHRPHIPFNLIGASGTIGGASFDGETANATPFGQVPKNAFFALNNNFGKGSFVNGVDYTSTIMGYKSSFPNGTILQWNWPDAGSGSGFAYAYPLVNYGASNFSVTNPYDPENVVSPAAKRISDFIALSCTYNISPGGNLNSYDVLIDSFVTSAQDSTDGSYVAEISFYPYNVPNTPLYGSRHTFSFGDAYVGQIGQEILIQPVVSGASTVRNILAATIDFREILSYLVSLGWLSGNEYVRGFQFGVEVQVPASYNSTPHSGSMRINQLSYDWR